MVIAPTIDTTWSNNLASPSLGFPGAGEREEDTAARRLEAVVRIAAPALIVGLGGLIGLLMASLLSGVSEIGQSASQ